MTDEIQDEQPDESGKSFKEMYDEAGFHVEGAYQANIAMVSDLRTTRRCKVGTINGTQLGLVQEAVFIHDKNENMSEIHLTVLKVPVDVIAMVTEPEEMRGGEVRVVSTGGAWFDGGEPDKDLLGEKEQLRVYEVETGKEILGIRHVELYVSVDVVVATVKLQFGQSRAEMQEKLAEMGKSDG